MDTLTLYFALDTAWLLGIQDRRVSRVNSTSDIVRLVQTLTFDSLNDIQRYLVWFRYSDGYNRVNILKGQAILPELLAKYIQSFEEPAAPFRSESSYQKMVLAGSDRLELQQA